MSHTTELTNGWVAIHDGDYRGEVILRNIRRRPLPEGDVILQEVVIPSAALFSYVASAVRHQKTVQIGDASDSEILGLK